MKAFRILFYKRDIQWPFRSGHDVHTTYMMRALAAAGHHVGLVTVKAVPAAVRDSLPIELVHTLDPVDAEPDRDFGFPPLQERFRRFWGISSKHLEAVQQLSTRFAANAVITPGLEALPVLAAIRGPLRIWYAADEWVLHHLSQLRVTDAGSWRNLTEGAIKGTYERAFSKVVDRAWAVSDLDAWAFRRFAGMPTVDIIPNGVDPEKYPPSSAAQEPFSAVFWGRLDFGPNIQGLQWFCSRVWPLVIERHAQARFTILGFQPGEAVQRLARTPGVTLCPDVPEIQSIVHSHAVVVLPFKSGTGIKNKLLEAAAMGKAIVCTPTALSGLADNPPFAGLDDPRRWVEELSLLWREDSERARRGLAARQWVTEHHTWSAAARKAESGIAEGLADVKRTRQV